MNVNMSGHFGYLFQVAFLGALLKKYFPGCYVGWVLRKASYASCLKYASGIDEVLVADRTIPIEQQVAKNSKTFASYDYVFTPDCSSHYRAKFGRKAFRNAIHIGASPRYMKRKSAGYLLRHHYDFLYDFNPHDDCYRFHLVSALNQALGCDISLRELAMKEPIFSLPEKFYREMRKYLVSDRPNVVIVPRINVPFKDFPERGFIHLIRNTKNLYHHIVTYGAKKEEAAHRIAKATGATILRQHYSIHHLTALMEMADMAVGGDTGPLHLAWAQNTKTLGLFHRKSRPELAFYGAGIYDAHMLPVLCHFPNIINFLPSLVRSWERTRYKSDRDQKLYLGFFRKVSRKATALDFNPCLFCGSILSRRSKVAFLWIK